MLARWALGRRPADAILDRVAHALRQAGAHLPISTHAGLSRQLPDVLAIEAHPMFQIVDGPISSWERV
jgi:hypothetical protein